MKFTSMTDNRPYMNVVFGNFYNPAFTDESFIDKTMQLVKELGFNSVMFDTKAWEDFKERCETGALSQYVKMQEYMGRSAASHGLSYNFLLLYMNGDNLYPHIRYSPPIYGEETVDVKGRPAGWYKYWSKAARQSMKEHVERILGQYKDGCERCLVDAQSDLQKNVVPVCSMWDPVVAPSFDADGRRRYLSFLEKLYGGDLQKLNRAYGISAGSFAQIKPEQYWYPLKYGADAFKTDVSDTDEFNMEASDTDAFFTEEDVALSTPRFRIWRDNALWKMQELTEYFQAMQQALKERHTDLFLCPNMSQWGYFLNIYGRSQADLDNEFSDLWDTAVRGIDIYALAPYVDACHFMTVPVTPDGFADAWAVSCQHSMMRVMNEGKPLIGGVYWGRYIYYDLYAYLTPCEIIGTMAACGVNGYTCYGINGLDDGGVLNRMEPHFLDSLSAGNRWLSDVLSRRKGSRKKEIAILFPSEMAHFEPFEVGNNKIRRLDLSGWYKLCCDLGYQADVISSHQIAEGKLWDYRILIVAANDCYGAVSHKKTEALIKDWVKKGGVLLHGPFDELAGSCFGIVGEPCEKLPYRYDVTIIPQGAAFCKYEGGEPVSEYTDGTGCVMAYKGARLSKISGLSKGAGLSAEAGPYLGAVYSFGVQIGASYASKNIPHVPYGQGNKEMYPFVLSDLSLVKDILNRHCKPQAEIRGRGIETGGFSNGMVVVNHRSTPFSLPKRYASEVYQYQNETAGVLPGHSAVWLSWEETSD